MKYITTNDSFITKDYFGFEINSENTSYASMKYNMVAIGRWKA